MSARILRRCLAVLGAAALLTIPTAAGAHVEASGETADGITAVTFSFHHGCDGLATTSLRVKLPESATDVVPQDPPGWTSTVTDGQLEWSGGTVPADGVGTFVATMRISDPEGSVVFLPTVQGCPDGKEAAWIDRSDDPEASNAAPRIVAGVVVGAPAPAPTSEPTTTMPAATTNSVDETTPITGAAPAAEDASSSTAPLLIAVVAVIVIGGAIALVLFRRRSASS